MTDSIKAAGPRACERKGLRENIDMWVARCTHLSASPEPPQAYSLPSDFWTNSYGILTDTSAQSLLRNGASSSSTSVKTGVGADIVTKKAPGKMTIRSLPSIFLLSYDTHRFSLFSGIGSAAVVLLRSRGELGMTNHDDQGSSIR